MKLPFLRSRAAKCQKFHVVQLNYIKNLETLKRPLIEMVASISVPTEKLLSCWK